MALSQKRAADAAGGNPFASMLGMYQASADAAKRESEMGRLKQTQVRVKATLSVQPCKMFTLILSPMQCDNVLVASNRCAQLVACGVFSQGCQASLRRPQAYHVP